MVSIDFIAIVQNAICMIKITQINIFVLKMLLSTQQIFEADFDIFKLLKKFLLLNVDTYIKTYKIIK